MKITPELLKQTRAERGIATASEAARQIGVCAPAYRRWESGEVTTLRLGSRKLVELWLRNPE